MDQFRSVWIPRCICILVKFLEPRAFDIIASGSGKIISGELSPSALVVASAGTTAHANGFEISDDYLNNLAQDYVKFVGMGWHSSWKEDYIPWYFHRIFVFVLRKWKLRSSMSREYDVKDSTLREVEGKLAVLVLALNLRLRHDIMRRFEIFKSKWKNVLASRWNWVEWSL